MPELIPNKNPNKKLHIAMFPWIAMGHITPFVHLANELAKRGGHSISLLIPGKAAVLLAGIINLHPHLVKIHVVSVPRVKGLPPNAETASDVDNAATNALASAFDAMSPQVETLLSALKPDIVLYDFACWITDMAAKIGFKTVCYNVICASYLAFGIVPARRYPEEDAGWAMSAQEMMEPPERYPSSTVVLRHHEARTLSLTAKQTGVATFDGRFTATLKGCDAIGVRTCRELEGSMCDYLSAQYGGKRVLLSGPLLSSIQNHYSRVRTVEGKWEAWLQSIKCTEPKKPVIYCAFGSQMIMKKQQFQELVLGLEMTGLPFFAALSKPHGVDSIEEALPAGFLKRVGGRGVVYGGWVQQTQILSSPSVGCFVSHCGFGSMWESLLSESRIVLVPQLADQMLNTRLLVEEMKVAVEVERGEMGWFSKEDLCRAIKSVMDEGSEVGKVVKENHAKWRETLVAPGFMDGYMDDFITQLHQL